MEGKEKLEISNEIEVYRDRGTKERHKHRKRE
jgi:hypothetical protein